MSKRSTIVGLSVLLFCAITLIPQDAFSMAKPKRTAPAQPQAADPNDSYQGGYQVGVYYMPSWDMLDSNGVPISPEPDMKWHHLLYNDAHSGFTRKRKYTPQHPWEGPFLDREPKLGWYDDADPKVWSQQLDWMADHGIDFIAFDWFWYNPQPTYAGWEMMHEPLHAYVKANQARPESRRVKFLLNWCSDGGYYPGTLEALIAKEGMERARQIFLEDFDSRIQTRWIPYFKESFYVKQDGKPVMYVYQAEGYEERAKMFGLTYRELLARARAQVIEAGFPGLVVIGGSDSIVKTNYRQTIDRLRDQTFDGTTAYFYHEYAGPNGNDKNQFFHKYPKYDGTGDHMHSGTWFGPEEMVKAYGLIWNDIRNAIGDRPFQYPIPVTPGFDRRPMGGSFFLDKDVPDHSQFPNAYPHDQMGTPEDFEKMLREARRFANASANSIQGKTILICSWNEYTEGSMIEPTKKWGTAYLEKIREVFKPEGWTPPKDESPVAPPAQPSQPIVQPTAPPVPVIPFAPNYVPEPPVAPVTPPAPVVTPSPAAPAAPAAPVVPQAPVVAPPAPRIVPAPVVPVAPIITPPAPVVAPAIPFIELPPPARPPAPPASQPIIVLQPVPVAPPAPKPAPPVIQIPLAPPAPPPPFLPVIQIPLAPPAPPKPVARPPVPVDNDPIRPERPPRNPAEKNTRMSLRLG